MKPEKKSPGGLSPYIKWAVAAGMFGGSNRPLSQRAYWLGETDPSDDEWVDALYALDTKGDKAPLLKLLRASDANRDRWLADLLDRYQLERKRGGRRTPAYSRSEMNIRLDLALDSVAVLRGIGVPRAEAIKLAAIINPIDPRAIEQTLDGKRGDQRYRKWGQPRQRCEDVPTRRPRRPVARASFLTSTAPNGRRQSTRKSLRLRPS